MRQSHLLLRTFSCHRRPFDWLWQLAIDLLKPPRLNWMRLNRPSLFHAPRHSQGSQPQSRALGHSQHPGTWISGALQRRFSKHSTTRRGLYAGWHQLQATGHTLATLLGFCLRPVSLPPLTAQSGSLTVLHIYLHPLSTFHHFERTLYCNSV